MKGIKKFVKEKNSTRKRKIVSEDDLGPYTVIKLREKGNTLFDCIPDIWFVDENRDRCLWPPPKGKNVAIRALKQDSPEDDWEIYACEVVKGGFATYSSGRALVREKCTQNYNTSSADEHLAVAKFRRQHPGLNCSNVESFEGVFAEKKAVQSIVSAKDASSGFNSTITATVENNTDDVRVLVDDREDVDRKLIRHNSSIKDKTVCRNSPSRRSSSRCSTSFISESRRMSDESKRRSTSLLSENRSMSYESKRRSTSFLSESRLMSDESKRRSTGYLSESRLMSDESKRRSTGFLSESRSMSDESKRRSTSFLSESRSMSDESKRRSTSFLSESRSMSDESKRRSTSLLSENRSMSYESKRRSTSFLSESRLMSDDER